MAVATEILRIVFRYRRLRQTSDGYAANPCPSCLAPHLEYVKRFVLAGQPVHFVLPAFPGERSPFGSAAQVEKGLGQVEKELEEIGVS